ncbi:iron-sulfur cluster carrier protein ApbC [Telmatospirillum sp.]|uniref:iron-sulfur cluster carrier protein ApbC n=1 Tax=Telmatospirillum sp. TaxID=2079197 RepID=UPI00283DE1C5|nr:iron-sulfur cluster carrier protein ApbC [Telmatospirillum sp.]MDR3437677.1 iron-sulfur cluster carrier protein ApbC [Telmatospirillum sp.]
MAEITEKDVLEALGTVFDPERQQDIVSLGMISGLTIKGGHVVFAIEVDPERGPHLEPLRKAAEDAVNALPGVLTVSAVLTAQHAAHGHDHDHGHDHGHGGHGHAHGGHEGHGHAAEEPLMPGVKAIIAVASGKGGVGKSTTAVNLALALQSLGLSVGMFDADIFGPSQPRMLGVSGAQPTSPDGQSINPIEAFGLKVMSIGFLVPEDSPVVWRGPMVMGALEQMMRQVQWGELDVLVVDMPPGTGDTQLTMTQRVPLTGAVIVSTPQDIALLDARKGLNMFRQVNVPVLGIIENMSYYICPNCGHEAHIFGHGGAKFEAVKLSTDFLGEIPLDIDIRTTSDEGQPIVVSKPESPHAQAYKDIAGKIWDKVQLLKTSKKGPKIVME